MASGRKMFGVVLSAVLTISLCLHVHMEDVPNSSTAIFGKACFHGQIDIVYATKKKFKNYYNLKTSDECTVLRVVDRNEKVFALKIYNRMDGRTFKYENGNDTVPVVSSDLTHKEQRQYDSQYSYDQNKAIKMSQTDMTTFNESQKMYTLSAEDRSQLSKQISDDKVLEKLLGHDCVSKFLISVWEWEHNLIPPISLVKNFEGQGGQASFVKYVDARKQMFIVKIIDKIENVQMVNNLTQEQKDVITKSYSSEVNVYKALKDRPNKNTHSFIASTSGNLISNTSDDAKKFSSWFPTFDQDVEEIGLPANRSNFPRILLPFAAGGDLISMQAKPTGHSLKEMTYSMIGAVTHMHSLGYVHCDVKPDNWLVGKYVDQQPTDITLADYGLSIKMSDYLQPRKENGVRMTIEGTNMYLPPEMDFQNEEQLKALDLWAVGCTLLNIIMSVSKDFVNQQTANWSFPFTNGFLPAPIRNSEGSEGVHPSRERDIVFDVDGNYIQLALIFQKAENFEHKDQLFAIMDILLSRDPAKRHNIYELLGIDPESGVRLPDIKTNEDVENEQIRLSAIELEPLYEQSSSEALPL